MRITGGSHKGHKLLPVNSDLIRPTTDKIRLAVFNSIMQYELPYESHVLDLYSGTGALGLEAISRGAIDCDFVDMSQRSLTLSKNNAQKLKYDMTRCRFIKQNCLKFLETTQQKEAFYSLVFIDPPYNKNLAQPTLQLLDEGNILQSEAICVVESEANVILPHFTNLQEMSCKVYGDTRIGYYKFKNK